MLDTVLSYVPDLAGISSYDLLKATMTTFTGMMAFCFLLILALSAASVHISNYVFDKRTAVCIGKREKYWNHIDEVVAYPYYGKRFANWPSGLVRPLAERLEPHIVVLRLSDGAIVAACVSPWRYARTKPGEPVSKPVFRSMLRRQCCAI
jgi:hypothetical protein